MALSVGSKVGPYEIVALVGAGGMGEVYRARDAALGRDVAVKVLPTAFAEDADRLRRFKQEAQAAASLNHPGILHHLPYWRARRRSLHCLRTAGRGKPAAKTALRAASSTQSH